MYTIIDENSTYIEDTVQIGNGSVIYPNVMLVGNTIIGENTKIYVSSYIENSVIGNNNTVYTSYIIDSEFGDNNLIGPYAYILGGSVIENNNKIGSFVQIKNSAVKNGARIKHLSYVGDTIVEDNVNIGAGAQVANYDGEVKHRTLIKEGVFVGCNAVLVAPVTLNKNSVVAAGSTITDEVPEGNLAIARCRQTNKERE